MAAAFYGVMWSLALVWASLTTPGAPLLWRMPTQDAVTVPWWAAGVGLGLILTLATWVAEPLWPALRRLTRELAGLIGRRPWWDTLALAGLSSVAEEALFRGPMQHALGYVVTSVLFALVHGGPTRRTYAWGTFALVAGLSFGLLAEAYGSIWPGVVAHFVVNAINLRRLSHRSEAQ